MKLNDYQTKAVATAMESIRDDSLAYLALGLTGESGEVADKVKKIIRDKDGVLTDEDREEIAKEMGDVLWYIGVGAKHLGYTLEDIARMNIDKLASRKRRGVLSGSGDNR